MYRVSHFLSHTLVCFWTGRYALDSSFSLASLFAQCDECSRQFTPTAYTGIHLCIYHGDDEPLSSVNFLTLHYATNFTKLCTLTFKHFRHRNVSKLSKPTNSPFWRAENACLLFMIREKAKINKYRYEKYRQQNLPPKSIQLTLSHL